MDSQDTCQGQVVGMEAGRDLRAGILDILAVAQDDRATRGKGWIPLGCSWGSGKRAWRKGRVGRWWMGRIATSRIPSVRRVWIWSGIGIPHVQMFPSAQEWRKKRTGVSRRPVTLTPSPK